MKNLFIKLKESMFSILPIFAIILILSFTVAPMPTGTLMLLISGTLFLILGTSIFTLGSEMAMIPIGEIMGSRLTRSRKLWVLIIGSLILGIIVTIAEPDLQVLTKQVPSVPDFVLVFSVAIGVGLFLVIAMLRIIFKFKLATLFILMYGLVFIIAIFTAPDYLAVAFDSGGVTTGPITVPFILALGSGVSSVNNSKNSEEDSFGLCAICSIGPIVAVLVMGMFYDPSNVGHSFEAPTDVANFSQLAYIYLKGLVEFLEEVVIALLPISMIFCILNFFILKLPKVQFIKIVVGLLYTIFGLTIFLTGVNLGFMPAGSYLGHAIASLSYNWILIPISVVIGCAVVAAEPAVYVLNTQVDEITSGAISKKMMMLGISAGVGISLALAMIRIMTGISIWFFVLPGYIIALILTFFVPKLFTAIAFDSGGVASGTMAAAFLLPFAVGACEALGGNTMVDAFGIIAMVAMMPLITVQIMGLIYQIKINKINIAESKSEYDEIDSNQDEISIEIDSEFYLENPSEIYQEENSYEQYLKEIENKNFFDYLDLEEIESESFSNKQDLEQLEEKSNYFIENIEDSQEEDFEVCKKEDFEDSQEKDFKNSQEEDLEVSKEEDSKASQDKNSKNF